MKKINLFVTGMILGGKSECDATGCRYDFSWLTRQPSMLIWSDKIILTSYCYDNLQSDEHRYEGKKMGKALQKIFDVAKEFGIVEIKNPDLIINNKLEKKISKEIEWDRELLLKLYPKAIKKGKKGVPGQIFVEGYDYCDVYLQSIYKSLILAREWEAESLFSPSALAYSKYKFGMSLYQNKKETTQAFNSIFNVLLPEKDLFPYYALDDTFTQKPNKNCANCQNTAICDKNLIPDVENNVRQYLELREYDEIQQIKGVIQDIVQKLEQTKNPLDHKEIIKEFRKQEQTINHDIKVTFPKIRRWSNLGIIASLSIIPLGVTTGLPIISYAGATAAGISQVTKEALEYSENKYNWVAFLQKHGKEKFNHSI